MSEAVTQPNPGEGSPPAGGQELLIPKQRLDEVTARLRRAEEEIELKNRLILEDRQRSNQAQQPKVQRQLPTAEELNMDPTNYQAMVKLAALLVEEKTQVLGQQIGYVAHQTEKAGLLASRGSDKAKYFPEIERIQQEHLNRTGTYMSTEIAFALAQDKEKDERIRQLEAQVAGKPASAPAPTPQPNPPAAGPNPAHTRQVPTSGAGAVGKPSPGFSSGSIEDLEKAVKESEARLQEHFSGGFSL